MSGFLLREERKVSSPVIVGNKKDNEMRVNGTELQAFLASFVTQTHQPWNLSTYISKVPTAKSHKHNAGSRE